MRVTGYTWDESIGRNCRFLQGARSEPSAIEAIREGIRLRKTLRVSITNYTKSGKPVLNVLAMRPVFEYTNAGDAARKRNGVPRYYIGVQHFTPVLRKQSSTLEAKTRLVELDGLVRLLPASIIVPRPAGSVDLNDSDAVLSPVVSPAQEVPDISSAAIVPA